MGSLGSFASLGRGDLSCIFRQLEGWPGAGWSRMALLCSMCLSFSNRLAGACSCDGGRNLRVTKPSCIRGQEETHTCFQASDCMNFAIILSFKTSHTSEPGNYRMTGKGCGYRQVIYWGHHWNPSTPVPKSAIQGFGCTQVARVRKNSLTWGG